MLVAASIAAGSAPNPIQSENALGGTQPSAWLQPAVPPTSIEGWASEVSVLPGEQVHLHVSTRDGDRYTVELYRLGWYGGLGARLVDCVPSCGGDKPGQHYGAHIENGLIRADWPVTDTLTIPAAAVSGYYYALLRVTSGGDDTGARAHVAFVVRDPPSRRSQILVQVPVNTWQAYNPWGGKSLYPFNSTDMVPAKRVSFDRPLAFTAQGPFDWEYNLVRFLEREGYDVSYQTDVDTDARPTSLLDHRLAIVNGHDEYWTKQLRDAFNSARDAGTNLAFIGSNAGVLAGPLRGRTADDRRLQGRGTRPGAESCTQDDPFPVALSPTARVRVDGRDVPSSARAPVGPRGLHRHERRADEPVVRRDGLQPRREGSRHRRQRMGLSAGPAGPATCAKPQLKVLFHFEGQPADADGVRYTATSGARVFAGGAQQLSWALDTFNLTRFGRTFLPIRASSNSCGTRSRTCAARSPDGVAGTGAGTHGDAEGRRAL